MAKDGTARGGQRVGSGAKKKPLADRILDGQATASQDFPRDTSEIECPPVKEWMKAPQHNGIELEAEKVYRETWDFLVGCGCERKVNPQILELYAMNMARWRQCEELISKEGLIGSHPTTGGAIPSPYVSMSREYSKQANAAWYQISAIIRENSEVYVDTAKQQNDLMEDLLSGNSQRKKA